MYSIIYSPQAKDDLLALQHSEPAAFRKAATLIEELKVHPRTGTGHPDSPCMQIRNSKTMLTMLTLLIRRGDS